MALFTHWLTFRDVAFQLDLLESADYFNPQAYNAVFDSELEKLIRRLPDSEARRQAIETKGFDWANYIVHSLARAGFRADDVEEHFHAITIRLLVEPGRLFKWEPQRHGPLSNRFRRSVWNSIRNLVEKTRNRRRWMTSHDPSILADRMPAKAPYNNIIGEFRGLVLQRLGRLALAILDARLADEELKGLIGRPELGSPSAYQIKREVGEIKRLAHQFAQQTGDSALAAMVTRAFSAEAATVAKRKAAVAAQ